MVRTLTSISVISCLAGVASAAPTSSFPDGSHASGTLRGQSSSTGIATIESAFDRPVMMLSGGPANQTPTHLKPTKPASDDTSFGSDASKTKPSVLVPLPAPAGLAIAGMLLLGATRRR